MNMSIPGHDDVYRLPFSHSRRWLAQAFWSLAFLLAALLVWRHDLDDGPRER